jgi:hypothetical protein
MRKELACTRAHACDSKINNFPGVVSWRVTSYIFTNLLYNVPFFRKRVGEAERCIFSKYISGFIYLLLIMFSIKTRWECQVMAVHIWQ